VWVGGVCVCVCVWCVCVYARIDVQIHKHEECSKGSDNSLSLSCFFLQAYNSDRQTDMTKPILAFRDGR